jgi:hypothetical protein
VFLKRTLQNLNECVQGWTAELVLNLDEVGISEREDCKARKVVLRATMRRRTIHHGISRKVKHLSVIAYVSTPGESFTPYIITSQDCPSVREQVTKHGVRFGLE